MMDGVSNLPPPPLTIKEATQKIADEYGYTGDSEWVLWEYTPFPVCRWSITESRLREYFQKHPLATRAGRYRTQAPIELS